MNIIFGTGVDFINVYFKLTDEKVNKTEVILY
jgi:hypothetical protein